jgi:hypothetical protein
MLRAAVAVAARGEWSVGVGGTGGAAAVQHVLR